MLYLNGDGIGIVNNCCFPSAVAPSYAPSGSVSSMGLVIDTSAVHALCRLMFCPQTQNLHADTLHTDKN